MIEVSEFIGIIKNSIQYKTKDDISTPYLILEDELMICPYCGKDLKMDKAKKIYCNCQKSEELRKQYNSLFNQIKILNDQVETLNTQLQQHALERFKTYYKEKVMPRILNDISGKNAAILAIESI